MTAPRLVCNVWWAPKRGCSADEYEDAAAVDAAAGRVALADGAAESSYSGAWANLLVEGFIQTANAPAARWAGGLPALRRRWAERMADDLRPTDQPLPWFAAAKNDEGAFSTFLGLSIREGQGSDPDRWEAVAVGDTCVFLVRNDGLERAFPVRRSSDFHDHPDLVGTGDDAPARVRHLVGACQPGDRFLLMTDALAQWFLRSFEQGGRPWDQLGPLDPPRFAAWVDALRDARVLANDDVTLVEARIDARVRQL